MELTYDIIRPGFYADGRVYNSKLLFILKYQYAVSEKQAVHTLVWIWQIRFISITALEELSKALLSSAFWTNC